MSIVMHYAIPKNTTFVFDNGYEVSISIGGFPLYSGQPVESEVDERSRIECKTAEIMIFAPKESALTAHDMTIPVGWVTSDKIAEVMYWTSKGNMNAVAKILRTMKKSA
jgi:hypothetical protein